MSGVHVSFPGGRRGRLRLAIVRLEVRDDAGGRLVVEGARAPEKGEIVAELPRFRWMAEVPHVGPKRAHELAVAVDAALVIG